MQKIVQKVCSLGVGGQLKANSSYKDIVPYTKSKEGGVGVKKVDKLGQRTF